MSDKSRFKLSDIASMKDDELRQFAVELVRDAEANAEIIRQLQTRVDVHIKQLEHLANEKASIASVRDQHKIELDVYKQIFDRLVDRLIQTRGYD